MRDMAHSICLIKLYQIPMRKKFRFFVSDYLKFISGFDMVLGFSELIVNLRWSGVCELREQNCLQSEWVIIWLHSLLLTYISTNKTCKKKVTRGWRKSFTDCFHFWSKCVLYILVWNKWDYFNMTFKAFKEFMVRFLFQNHETLKLYSCNLKYFTASRYLKYSTNQYQLYFLRMWTSIF